MNKLKQYFFKGLLYVVPMSVTFWVLIMGYQKLNDIIGKYLTGNWQYLGILILIILIIFVGFLGSSIIARPINSFFQRLLKKAPLLETIYTSVKDLMGTFIGKKKGFEKAVLVKLYENSTIERIGFITNEDVTSLNIAKGKVLVYMPHSYAISGQLFVVEKKNVSPIDKSSAEIMKLIVSGGVTEIDN